MISPENDAYGQELYAYFQGKQVHEIIERDDGFIASSADNPKGYFAPFEEWPAFEQQAIGFARGRVLDVGCGAGRVALHLQNQGLEVVAIDNSPLAVEVCRQRGVQDVRLCSITQASRARLGDFDTILMFGNNFGLLANPRRAKWLLKRFYGMTGAHGRILAMSNDIYQTDDPLHLAYHEFNRRRGRMPGQIRLRVRHGKTSGPWFDYLMVSKEEMGDILAGTGWQIAGFHDSAGSGYIARLEK